MVIASLLDGMLTRSRGALCATRSTIWGGGAATGIMPVGDVISLP